MPVQYSVIIKMGCGKKIAAAVHIDIIVFYFSKQYNEDKKGCVSMRFLKFVGKWS